MLLLNQFSQYVYVYLQSNNLKKKNFLEPKKTPILTGTGILTLDFLKTQAETGTLKKKK